MYEEPVREGRLLVSVERTKTLAHARRTTRSRDEVSALLARMDDVEPLVNAVCTVHPDALGAG